MTCFVFCVRYFDNDQFCKYKSYAQQDYYYRVNEYLMKSTRRASKTVNLFVCLLLHHNYVNILGIIFIRDYKL